MTAFEFDLIISGLDLEAHLLELAGFEDRVQGITLSSHAGVVRAAVERAAPSLGEAVRSAIADVESIPGALVTRVEPDEHVSQVEIAHRLGRSRQSVSQWVSGARGPGGFPPPAVGSGHVALWRWSEVVEWLGARGLRGPADEDRSALVIAAANALLEARRAVGALVETERASLADLVA